MEECGARLCARHQPQLRCLGTPKLLLFVCFCGTRSAVFRLKGIAAPISTRVITFPPDSPWCVITPSESTTASVHIFGTQCAIGRFTINPENGGWGATGGNEGN